MKIEEISVEERIVRVSRCWHEVAHWLDNWRDCSGGEWDDKESVLDLPVGREEAPLCWAYHSLLQPLSRRSGGDCTNCPIADFTGDKECRRTPLQGMLLELTQSPVASTHRREYHKAAAQVEEMYRFVVMVALVESQRLLDRLYS